MPDIFKVLDQIAERVPAGANGVLYTPWIWGERAPVEDKTLRAGLYNLSLHNSREDIIRAFLEGIAFNTRWLLQPVEKFLGREVSSINIVGGGAQSDVWCQIFADVMNVGSSQVEDPVYANARGAAWIGAVGLGEISFADVPALVKIKRILSTATSRTGTCMMNGFNNFYSIYKQMKPCLSPYERLSQQTEESTMTEKTFRLYPYRWVVLAVFMFINLTIQILWISYAPITGVAAAFYGVTDLKIGLLAMIFMIAFIPLSIPVSWAIDTYGFRLTVSIGAVLMGVFGVVRGLAGADYITGADQHHRHCHCPALPAQCLDEGAGAVVQH